MICIETLVGVTHGAETMLGLNIEASPSFDLVHLLKQLPKGTPVGIESFPPDQSPPDKHKVDGVPIRIGAHRYWERIEDILRYSGLETIYLDDPGLYEQYTAYKVRAYKQMKSLSGYLKRKTKQNQEVDPLHVRKYKENIYGAQVRAEKIHLLDREKRLIENIVKYQPRVVIIGLGHADYLVSEARGFADYGLIVGSYYREKMDVNYTYDPPMGINYFSSEALSSSIDVGSLRLARECLARRFKAVTEGRVTGMNPDFIGTWNLDNEREGLFELFVASQDSKTGTIEGTIEDCLGSASFRGTLGDNEIEFSKYYDLSRSLETVVKGSIMYRGVSKRGELFMGEFYGQMEDIRGGFILQRGSKLTFD